MIELAELNGGESKRCDNISVGECATHCIFDGYNYDSSVLIDYLIKNKLITKVGALAFELDGD